MGFSAQAAATALQLALASVPCSTPYGTPIIPVYFNMGSGNPMTFRLSGDTQEFGFDGKSFFVKVIDPTNCGTVQSITLTVSQN